MIKKADDRAVTGVILAGGQARRMGEIHKSLLPLNHQSILDHVITRARPQVQRLLINVNSDTPQFRGYDLPLIKDSIPDYAGPLAGVLAAMEFIHADTGDGGGGEGSDGSYWLASFPADSPFFPADLVQTLLSAAIKNNADIACATRHGSRSPLFALWDTHLREDLRQQLEQGQRKVAGFQQRHNCVLVPFDAEERDPFFNINTPDDLQMARSLAREAPD